MEYTISDKVNYLDFKTANLDYKNLAEKIKKDLNEVGYIVVQNFDSDPNDIEDSKKKLLEICELVGKPVSHDGNNKIIWDIKSNPESNSFIKTYSEHNHEADLHTDSQYSYYPEDYFSLLTLKKADCGGGISFLLTLENILDSLLKLENSEEIIRILSSTDFPFIVPNVFKKLKNDKVEFNYGPILRKNEIRFRVDTFEKAISHEDSICTEEQINAYKILKDIILNNSRIEYFYLEPKDLIFLNNKTILHGRSEFSDSKRHMLRIRMNKE